MMTTTCRAIIAISALTVLSTASARDDHLKFPVSGALAKGESFKEKVDKDIKLYFGKQKSPAIAKTIGERTSNRKTNAANKSDQDACDIAFLSAIVSLQQDARQAGGNAVINIRSVYKNENLESNTEYLCGAGSFVAGVALRGTVVKLGGK